MTAQVHERDPGPVAERARASDSELGRDVAGRQRPLSDRMLGRRRGCLGQLLAGVGDRRTVADPPNPIHALDAQVPVYTHPAVLVERHVQGGEARVRNHAGRPNHRSGGDHLAGGEARGALAGDRPAASRREPAHVA